MHTEPGDPEPGKRPHTFTPCSSHLLTHLDPLFFFHSVHHSPPPFFPPTPLGSFPPPSTPPPPPPPCREALPIKGPGGWWHAVSLTGSLVSVWWGTWSGKVLFSAQTRSACYLTRKKKKKTPPHICAAVFFYWVWWYLGDTAQAEMRGRDGIRWGWGEGWLAGWEARQCGSPDLCARRYQSPFALSCFSKPFQMNNKLWALFDRHLSQTGQQMHAWWRFGHAKQRGQTGHSIWKGGHPDTTPTFLLFFFGDKQKQEIPH